MSEVSPTEVEEVKHHIKDLAILVDGRVVDKTKIGAVVGISYGLDALNKAAQDLHEQGLIEEVEEKDAIRWTGDLPTDQDN